MSKRDKFRMPVAGVSPEDLGVKLRASIEAVAKQWPPRTGITLLVFDYEAGQGMSYISNATRETMIKAMEEWLDHQRKLT